MVFSGISLLSLKCEDHPAYPYCKWCISLFSKSPKWECPISKYGYSKPEAKRYDIMCAISPPKDYRTFH